MSYMSIRPARQGGFTLIELVVVIVILGILAAVAVPRFAGMQRDARVAKLNATRAAVQSAATMVYAAAQARAGQGAITIAGCTATTTVGGGGDVCVGGQAIPIVNFYPQANAAGIVTAAGLAPQANPTPAQLAAAGYQIAGAGAAIGSTLTIQVIGGPTPAQCSFTYSPSTGGTPGTPANISAVNTTGC